MSHGKFDSTNEKHYPDLGHLAGQTSGSIAKCRLFAQASIFLTVEIKKSDWARFCLLKQMLVQGRMFKKYCWGTSLCVVISGTLAAEKSVFNKGFHSDVHRSDMYD